MTITRRSRHLAVMTAAILPLMLSATVARAGTWTLVSCQQPNGQAAPIDGWAGSTVDGPGNYSGTYSNCASGGGIVAESSNAAPQTRISGELWTFSAPQGSTITGGSLNVDLYSPQGQAFIATPLDLHDGSDVLANCQFNVVCSSNDQLGGPFDGAVPITITGGQHLYAEAQCIGSGQPGSGTADCAQGDGAGGVNAQAVIYAADIELTNTATPTASGVSGSLLSGTATGTRDVLFNAQDPGGPGVFTVTATVDGTSVYSATPDSNGGECASIGTDPNGYREFLHAQPCKTTEAVDLPINTTSLPAGPHTLKITVTDAAENSSVVYDGQFTSDNPPSQTTAPTLIDKTTPWGAPKAGDVLEIQPGAWSPTATYSYAWESCDGQGANCHTLPGQAASTYTVQPGDAGQVLVGELTATDTGGARQVQAGATDAVQAPSSSSPGSNGRLSATLTINGQPIAGVANGTPCPDPSITTKVNGKAGGATVRFPAGASVTGYLGCAATPIPDASLVVNGDGHPTSVRSNRAGQFTFRVTKRSPSRKLHFSYTAYSQDVAPAATATAALLVIPKITLSISPRATSNGGWMTWRATISGGPYPPGGVAMLEQVREAEKWHTFNQSSAPGGRLRYRYHFTHTFSTTTYRFRLALPHDGAGGYPYAPHASRTIAVRVT